MSVNIEVTISCDGDLDLIPDDPDINCVMQQEEVCMNRTATEARKQCKQYGWMHFKGKDYCPVCWKLYKENRTKE
jgi:hypothetical protein